MSAQHTPGPRGFSDAEIDEAMAIADALQANAEDFAALCKLKRMSPEMPGYVGFAKQFARNCIRDEQHRAAIAKATGSAA